MGVFTGIFAKEAVVGTLDALYADMAAEGAEQSSADGAEQPISTLLVEAAATIPENLAGIKDLLLDPLGLGVADLDQQAAAEELELTDGTLGAMASRFDGRVGAFAYLLFILLYTPCVAALGAIKRELGHGWMYFCHRLDHRCRLLCQHCLLPGQPHHRDASGLRIMADRDRNFSAYHLLPAADSSARPGNRPARTGHRGVTAMTSNLPMLLSQQGGLSFQDLTNLTDMKPETLRLYLDRLMARGHVRKSERGSACGGCTACPSGEREVFEWVGG